MPSFGPYSPQAGINTVMIGRLTYGDNLTTPGETSAHNFRIPDGATADIDIVVADKFEVVDVIVRKESGAGAGNTVTIKNVVNAVATPITNAIASDTDKTVNRATTIDPAFAVLAAGSILRVSATRLAGTRNSLVTIIGFIRP